MSYADVTARNAHQSPEEAYVHNPCRAPVMPQVEHTEEASTSSLIDVDSPHVSSVPSDFESQSVKTETQAARLEREADARGAQAEKKAKDAKEKAKAKLNKGRQTAKDNPILLGNALVIGVLGTALGVGAYRKYVAGELNWRVAGVWAGVVGLFAGADYFATSFLRQKYPQKK